MRRLYIFGAGGHGRELAWLAKEAHEDDVEIVFLVDDDRFLSTSVNEIPVRLLQDEVIEGDAQYVVALGDPRLRRAVAKRFQDVGATAATLIHPRVEMSPNVTIEAGVVLCVGNVLTDNVKIGRHSHVNVGCVISHDVQIGEFVTISPGVHVAGNVRVEDDVFIGVGANISNGVHGAPLVIGARSVIAAGACVLRSVEPDSLMAGVPAVRKR
jgi:sugar O-acyltransferase (sialic acid O-acetyltransferase NeuD family)